MAPDDLFENPLLTALFCEELQSLIVGVSVMNQFEAQITGKSLTWRPC